MSFLGQNMTPLGGNARAGDNALDRNAPMGWAYQSKTDTLAVVQATGYFDTFHLFLVAGQFIYVNLTDQKAFVSVQSVDHILRQVAIDSALVSGEGSGGGGSGAFPVEIFTGTDKNLIVVDNEKFFVMDNISAQTVNIPENAAQAFPVGAEMEFLRESSTATVTFLVSGAAVLHSRDGLVMINARYSAATLKKIATDEWRLIGDLA